MSSQPASTTDSQQSMPEVITTRNAVPVRFESFTIVLQVVKQTTDTGLWAKFAVSEGSNDAELSDWVTVGSTVNVLGRPYRVDSIERAAGNRGAGHGYSAVLSLKSKTPGV